MARKNSAAALGVNAEDLKQRNLIALIGVLQAPNTDYNITLDDAQAGARILRRFGINVEEVAANQITAGAAAVAFRSVPELQDLGIAADVPLYYQYRISGDWQEAAPILAKLKTKPFHNLRFAELWQEIEAENFTKAPDALMNVDGRRVAQAVETVLQTIIEEELAKVPAAA